MMSCLYITTLLNVRASGHGEEQGTAVDREHLLPEEDSEIPPVFAIVSPVVEKLEQALWSSSRVRVPDASVGGEK